MTACRRFHGDPVRRLIASFPLSEVKAIDAHIQRYPHKCRGNRSEFLRLAAAEQLRREGKSSAMEPLPGHTVTDSLTPKLDELADLCAYWARNRRSNREPPALRAAILQCVAELAVLSRSQQAEAESASA